MLRYPPEFEPLVAAFAKSGRQLWFVGGCIRDALMQLDDKGDWDCATDAHPEVVQQILRANQLRCIPIGIRFGTVATILAGHQVEITTFRRAERYEPGSRHPVVEFGSRIEEDLSRRDLSINAIAMAPSGELVDPFDGAGAIARRILEVPGGGLENSVSILRDDPLRLLRVARFAARFDFAPTAETTEAARQVRTALGDISRERWKMEIDKLLVARWVGRGIRWLGETGAIAEIFSDFSFDPIAVSETLAHRLERSPLDRTLRWGLLLAHVAAAAEKRALPEPSEPGSMPSPRALHAAVEHVADELRASNAERHAWRNLLDGPLLAADFSDTSRPRLRRWVDRTGIDAVRLSPGLADALSDGRIGGPTEAWDAAMRQLLADEDPIPRFPTGLGKVLMAELGIAGRAVGDAMDGLREAVLDGVLPNGAEIGVYVEFARERLRSRT